MHFNFAVVPGTQQLHGHAAGRPGQQSAGQRGGHPDRAGTVHPDVSVADGTPPLVLQRYAAGRLRAGGAQVVAGPIVRLGRAGGPVPGQRVPADPVAVSVSATWWSWRPKQFVSLWPPISFTLCFGAYVGNKIDLYGEANKEFMWYLC